MARLSASSRSRFERSDLGLVKSSARTLDILTLLTEHPEGMTLTEIGKRLKIPLSSLYALIGTLVQKDFVLRAENGFHYRLGPRILQLASAYRGQVDLITLADSVMNRIRRAVSETTSLSVLQGQMILFIHKRPAEGVVQVVNPVGTRLYAHATGSGKVMLAYLDEEAFERIYPEEALPALTPATIRSKSALKARLAEVRERNYAYDDEESAVGVWAVASCVRDEEGHPVAALSVVAPTSRLQTKDPSEWHLLVRAGAAEVSASLGFRDERLVNPVEVGPP